MDGIRTTRLTAQIARSREHFAQARGSYLLAVMPAALLKQRCGKPVGDGWRMYWPVQTLKLFLDQVLGADHSSQEAGARRLSERTALGHSPCSLNSADYCAARKRLPLSLVVSLAEFLGEIVFLNVSMARGLVGGN